MTCNRNHRNHNGIDSLVDAVVEQAARDYRACCCIEQKLMQQIDKLKSSPPAPPTNESMTAHSKWAAQTERWQRKLQKLETQLKHCRQEVCEITRFLADDEFSAAGPYILEKLQDEFFQKYA